MFHHLHFSISILQFLTYWTIHKEIIVNSRASVVFVLNSEMSVNIYKNFKLKSKSKQTKNAKYIEIGNYEDSIASVFYQIFYAEYEEKKVKVDGGREVTFIGEVRREHTFFLFFPFFFLFVFLPSSSPSFRRLSLCVQVQDPETKICLWKYLFIQEKKKHS